MFWDEFLVENLIGIETVEKKTLTFYRDKVSLHP